MGVRSSLQFLEGCYFVKRHTKDMHTQTGRLEPRTDRLGGFEETVRLVALLIPKNNVAVNQASAITHPLNLAISHPCELGMKAASGINTVVPFSAVSTTLVCHFKYLS